MRPYPPAPLPDGFGGRPFTVREAESDGFTRRRLRAHDLDATVRGVRAPSGFSAELVGRCRMFASRLDERSFFSHGTAALLYGAPLPWRLERRTDLHVTVPSPHRAAHARGLVGHSREVVEGDIVMREGLRLSSPARVVCELARVLDRPERVAVVDFLIQHRRPLTTTTDIVARATLGDRLGRGRRVLDAVELSSPRGESAPESKLRVLLVQMGLPEPSVDHVVVKAQGRSGIRTDLAYPHLRFAIEYQGDYHRSREQWRADMTRRTRLEALGWYILEVNADDLRRPDELAARIRAILARLGR